MSRNRLITLVLVAAGFGLLFRDVIVKLVHDWSVDENYSHGLLVVPLVVYILWRERDNLASSPSKPSWAGLVLIAGSIATLVAGRLGAELYLTRLAMLGTLSGIVVLLWGFGRLRRMSFEFLLLFLAIPIPAIIFNQIAFPLQLIASRFGETAIAACGIPVLREGNVIMLATTTLEVAEACSGIRSLVSLVTLALVWGYFSESALWLRWLLALSAVPIAIFSNAIRVAGTGVAAHFVGPEAAEGFLHTFSGWMVFVVAGVMMLAVHRLALWLAPGKSLAATANGRTACTRGLTGCRRRLGTHVTGSCRRRPAWRRRAVARRHDADGSGRPTRNTGRAPAQSWGMARGEPPSVRPPRARNARG